jgi:hypothetical protein
MRGTPTSDGRGEPVPLRSASESGSDSATDSEAESEPESE